MLRAFSQALNEIKFRTTFIYSKTNCKVMQKRAILLLCFAVMALSKRC